MARGKGVPARAQSDDEEDAASESGETDAETENAAATAAIPVAIATQYNDTEYLYGTFFDINTLPNRRGLKKYSECIMLDDTMATWHAKSVGGRFGTEFNGPTFLPLCATIPTFEISSMAGTGNADVMGVSFSYGTATRPREDITTAHRTTVCGSTTYDGPRIKLSGLLWKGRTEPTVLYRADNDRYDKAVYKGKYGSVNGNAIQLKDGSYSFVATPQADCDYHKWLLTLTYAQVTKHGGPTYVLEKRNTVLTYSGTLPPGEDSFQKDKCGLYNAFLQEMATHNHAVPFQSLTIGAVPFARPTQVLSVDGIVTKQDGKRVFTEKIVEMPARWQVMMILLVFGYDAVVETVGKS